MKKAFGLWILVVVAIVGAGIVYEKSSATNDNLPTQIVDDGKMKDKTDEVSSSQSGKELQKLDDKQDKNGKLRVQDITTSLEGKTVIVEGVASGVTEKNGNVFFVFRDPETQKSIKGVMFRKTSNDNEERMNLLEESQANNKKINIQGQVDIYKGELEIKTWKVYTE